MVGDLNELQRRIAALSPEKRALFEQQLKQRNLQIPSPTIPRRPDLADRPLSFAQQHLWFLHQLDPDSPAYNIAMLWRCNGWLDISILKHSLETIAQRHETLRTAFALVADQPVQIVLPSFSLSLPIIDLQAIPAPEALIQQLARQVAQLPFDLTQAPLWRAALLQTNTTSVLLLILHHSIADGWSRGVLLQEFAALYKAFQSGQPSPLPDLPIQYSDFAWQQSRQSEFAPQIAYWRQQLADLSPLDLVIRETGRAIEPSFRSGTRSLMLSATLLAALRTLSRRMGVTLFMTLLTAFKVLLYRYTGQADVAVGVPTANRHSREAEKLIGFFVNTLVLRTDLSGNPSVQALLDRVRQVAAAAYKHQDIPFAKLVEALHPQRHLSQNPFFQVMFQVQNEAYQLQNSLNPTLDIPNLELSQEWIDLGFTKFDLTWHLIERTEGILAVVEYRLDRFSAAAIDRMLGHFQVLLDAIVTDPSQRISELPILTASERQQLVNWSRGESDRKQPPFQLLHHQFEAQVERTPDTIAVIDEDQQLTYAELNARANQLAHYLQSLGIRPDTRVGISLDRSPDLMMGLLGILKSGAAYLPIDPQLPSDRVNFMLRDAQVKLLITEIITDTLPPSISPDISYLNLKTDWQRIASLPTHNPSSTVTASNLAYLIYTSGSTGQPKGTLLTHQGLSNYLNWCVQTYITPDAAGVPIQSSISFDATITSLYTPLLVGQPIVLLADAIESLAHLLTTNRHYSFIKLTPAHLRLLSQWLKLNSPCQLAPQTFILGGEALTEADLTFWHTHASGSRFINEYGPTEATVGCCVYQVPNDQSSVDTTATIPIGRPIPNTQLYLLDQYLQPVPVGIPGELYIGSIGLAQSYLHHPQLTAEKFIPNPFLTSFSIPSPHSPISPSPILYKTGDRACYLADGNLEYLGRFDDQVKIRGYRIELAEIAAVLKQHPRIQDAIVVVVQDHNQQTRLVAYIVANSGTSVGTGTGVGTGTDAVPTSIQLRQFLQPKLPDYMLPSLFIALEALPLTPNGKVNRRTLPQPEWNTATIAEPLPQTAIEAHLVQIWSEILGVSVGTHDNFFELGGDSILSLQIVARANQIGLKLPPRQLFQCQTIAELATVVESSIPAEQGMIAGDVPLTPIQHWFFEQNLPEPHHFNQALLLEVEAGLNPQHLEHALRTLWHHHDALRLRFVLETSGWRQFHAAPEAAIGWSVIDLSQLNTVAQTKAIETLTNALQASLNLSELLWRGILFQLGNTQTDRLLIISHHLIIDAVSWQILLEDLVTAYCQSQQQQKPQLPLKTTAFRTWAQQLVTYAESDFRMSEVEYWSEQFGLPLLIDHHADPSSNTVASSDQVIVTLETDPTHHLFTKFAKSHQTNLNAILLTALFFSFQQWTKSDSLLIDLESYGRDTPFREIDLSRTVGWFTCIFPVRLHSNSASQQEVLRHIQEQLQKVPNHGLNYGILRYLQPEKPLQNLSQAGVKFNYLGSIDRLTRSFILKFAPESTGNSISPPGQRRYLLEVNSWISQEQLHWSWTYSRNLHQRTTIEQLAQTCLATLKSLLEPEISTVYVVSDFPAARLSQKQLDQFVTKMQKPGRK